jgi:uncharacterized protein YggE
MSTRAWTGVGLVSALLVALIALIASSAFGQSATPEGGPPRTITVSSFATISTEPDEAVITFGVHTDDADSVAALNETSRIVNDVLAAMKSLDIALRDMETTNVSVSPQTINRGTAAETTIYNSSTALAVTIHDFDSIGVAIKDGVEAGATRVSGVRFQIGDPVGAKKKALEEAVQSARAKAEALAEAAGTSVTGVVRMREQWSSGAKPSPYFANSRTLSFAGDAELAVVPPRDIQTKVSIQVIWSIG